MQFTHILEGFGNMEVPHKQHSLQVNSVSACNKSCLIYSSGLVR